MKENVCECMGGPNTNVCPYRAKPIEKVAPPVKEIQDEIHQSAGIQENVRVDWRYP